MSFESLLQHSVTISRAQDVTPQAFDEHGAPVETFVDDAETTPCFVQQVAASESVVGGETSFQEYDVYFLPQVTLSTRDRLKWASRILQVLGIIGDPAPGGPNVYRLARCREVS